MASKSSIEWTQSTWNPVTGCSKISAGCKHCYAERMAKRLRAIGVPSYRNGFQVTLQRYCLEIPLRWKKPRMVFVNSMSDLFHEEIPDDYILEVFDVMNRADWHQYQILTKRPERLSKLNFRIPWRDHVWMGVSVENARYTNRIDLLRTTSAHVRFLSIEPLLGPIPSLDLQNIQCVIVGGESGPGARPVKEEWVTDIRDQCCRAQVPFFFKQWGGTNKKKAGRRLDGRTWDQMPRMDRGRRLNTVFSNT